jgi:hypothetical protein
MKTATVDMQHRIRLEEEPPETRFWVLPQPAGYLLQRIPQLETVHKPTPDEIEKILREQQTNSGITAAEFMKFTREID